MTSPHPTDLLGAYALNALDPDEAEVVRGHTAHCATCRREHEALAQLPALLDLATPPHATAPATRTPDTLEERVRQLPPHPTPPPHPDPGAAHGHRRPGDRRPSAWPPRSRSSRWSPPMGHHNGLSA